jgi:hypothetical protein
LRKKHCFGLPAAFGPSDDGFAVLNIHRPEFQNVPDPHAAAGHEFQHQPVALISGPENDLWLWVDEIL